MEPQRNFSILLVSLLLAVGTPLLAVGTQTDADRRSLIAGEVWVRGDGLGYNVLLNLGNDKRFKARWTGCLGEYGWSEGTWSKDEQGVSLVPSREEGMMQGHLRRLERVDLNGVARLIPLDDLDEAKRFDADTDDSTFYAFKLSRTIE